jgi:DNA-binding NtrC family response regulator
MLRAVGAQGASGASGSSGNSGTSGPPAGPGARRTSSAAETAAAVLVADDEPLLQRLMERILVGAGFAVLVAGDGDAALRWLEDAARGPGIGAVVLDVSMPPDGGDGTLARVGSSRPDLGVVMTSGAALAPHQREALERHDGVFLQKPFSPEALVRAVDEVLRRKARAGAEGS